MPLKRPTRPEPWKSFQERLADFVDPADEIQFLPPTASNYQAQLIFSLGIDEIVYRPGIAGAVYSTWRFLGPSLSRAQAVAAYVDDSASPGQGPVTGISYGPGIDHALQAAKDHDARIVNLPHVAAGNFESRVLQINGLSVEGFWLKSLGPQSDLMIPYQTLIPMLVPNETYQMDRFLARVRPEAKKLKSFWASQPRHIPRIRI